MSDQPKTKDDFFPGFIYSVQSISAFRIYLDVFIISLKEGHVVRYDAKEQQSQFRDWLMKHEIREA